MRAFSLTKKIEKEEKTDRESVYTTLHKGLVLIKSGSSTLPRDNTLTLRYPVIYSYTLIGGPTFSHLKIFKNIFLLFFIYVSQMGAIFILYLGFLLRGESLHFIKYNRQIYFTHSCSFFVKRGIWTFAQVANTL